MVGPTDDDDPTPPQSPRTKGIVQALEREVKKHTKGIDSDVQVTNEKIGVLEATLLAIDTKLGRLEASVARIDNNLAALLRRFDDLMTREHKNLHALNFLKMLGLEQPLVNFLVLLLFDGWNMARNILTTYHNLGLH
jgi:septal ring factor EnvC (AmiA/AmiB activator)